MKSVGIKEIAKKTGLSVGTVSNVLNNRTFVKEETRQKVLDVVRELDYVPNVSARQLRKNKKTKGIKNGCFGVVIPEKAKYSSSFFSKISDGILDEAGKYELKIINDFVKTDYRETIDLPLMVKDGSVDGIIVAGEKADKFISQMLSMEIPIVLVESYWSGTEISSILVDNFNGAYQAVKYLIDSGHKEIGLLHGPMEYPTVVDRFRGFKSALETYGLKYSEEFIEDGNLLSEDGYKAMQKILERGTFPTAIFAMNDYSALGAKKCIEDNGMKVPDDISIIGFDDIELASQVEPGLTTMHVPKEEIGRLAVKRLNELIEEKTKYPSKIVVPVKLIERGTVKRIDRNTRVK